MNTSDLLHTVARGPGGHTTRSERRKRRMAVRSLRRHSDNGAGMKAETLLLHEADVPHWLTVRANRRWSRTLSRLLAPSLDRKLAEGRPPESSLLLAVRAQALVSPAKRQALAYEWADVLAAARTPRSPRCPSVPINREAILASERVIRALTDVLVAPTPGQVRGIAVMNWLLTDGTGPLYNRHRSNALREVLLEVPALLKPSAI